jgi:LysM repeat protein
MVVFGLLVICGAAAGIYWLSNASGGPSKAGADTGKSAQTNKEGEKKALQAKTPEVKSLTGGGTGSGTPEPVRLTLGSGTPTGVQPNTPGVTPGPTPTPATTPTPGPTSTPPASETGKPASVDVTNPNGTSGGTPSGTPGATPAPGTSPPSNPGSVPASTPSPGTTPGEPIPATGSTSEVMNWMAEGDRKHRSGDLVGARALLSKALLSPKASKGDQETLRSKLSTISQDLMFSARVVPGDPMAEEYVVESGDGLQRIARKRGLVTDWRLIERINKVDSTKLKVGQKLKLVRGPFHAVVSRSDYRLDLYWGVPSDPENWVFVKSFKVGLGQNTPTGEFTVRTSSKQINPPWTNPQTGEKFAADDPKNPIGEYWVGIEGKGEAAKFKGFGIHGTIEPESIGQSKSMGCVRMLKDDVALVYELLMDPVSVVRIVP